MAPRQERIAVPVGNDFVDVSSTNPLPVAVMSGGGGGGGGGSADVQYADGATAATPTGNQINWNEAGTQRAVSTAKPLPSVEISTPITGQSLPSGSGVIGWLSYLYAFIANALGTLTETAPTTDTASSGLNGRLQRVAQNITTLIGAAITGQALEAGGSGNIGWLASIRKAITDRLPAALTTGGSLKVAQNEGTELHLGEVAGSGKCVKLALTVTAAAYAAGNAIGGKITIANAVRVSGGISILASIHLLDRANQKPTGTIYIFDADPLSASTPATLTDKTAFAFGTADLNVVATIPVASTDWITTNGKATANLRSLAAEVQASGSTSLYAAFVTTATPTFAATSDVQMIFDMVYVN